MTDQKPSAEAIVFSSQATKSLGLDGGVLVLTAHGDDQLCALFDQHTESLRKRIEQLEATSAGWMTANGPGGWIDDLRARIAAADKLAEAMETFRAAAPQKWARLTWSNVFDVALAEYREAK